MIALDNADLIRGDAAAANEVDFTLYGVASNVVTQLASGQLAVAEGTIYPSPAAGTVVTSIILVNTGAVARAINLYLQPSGGTSRRLIPKNLNLGSGYSLYLDGKNCVVLDTNGQTLSAWAVDDTPVDGETSQPISSNWAYDHVAGADPHAGYLLESLFDAYSILMATSDNTPIALSITEQTLVGRLTGGIIAAIAIGIADNNILQVDGSPNDDEAAVFTAAGIEGLTEAEFKTKYNMEAGVDYETYGAIAIHAALTAAHGATGAIVGTTNEQTLTLKTLTTPVIASLYQDAGKTKLMTVPDTASDTLVTLAASQILTAKTLTSPTINGTIGTTGLTLPAVTLGGDITTNGKAFDVGSGYARIYTTGELNLLLRTTNNGVTGAVIQTRHVSTSPAVNDTIFKLDSYGYDLDSPQNLLNYGAFQFGIEDPTADHADGKFALMLLSDQAVTYPLTLSSLGVLNILGSYLVDGVQVVSNRVVDARCDDAINSGDATTDGVIDALRDAMITHGLIAAA